MRDPFLRVNLFTSHASIFGLKHVLLTSLENNLLSHLIQVIVFTYKSIFEFVQRDALNSSRQIKLVLLAMGTFHLRALRAYMLKP